MRTSVVEDSQKVYVLHRVLHPQVHDNGFKKKKVKGRAWGLTSLLGQSKMQTRTGLLRDAGDFQLNAFQHTGAFLTDIKLWRNVLKLALESIRSLYNMLAVTFDPMTLCIEVAPLSRALSEDASYALYLPLLQCALLSPLISQLAQVYSSITLENFSSSALARSARRGRWGLSDI